jgi:hypothetical protein
MQKRTRDATDARRRRRKVDSLSERRLMEWMERRCIHSALAALAIDFSGECCFEHKYVRPRRAKWKGMAPRRTGEIGSQAIVSGGGFIGFVFDHSETTI